MQDTKQMDETQLNGMELIESKLTPHKVESATSKNLNASIISFGVFMWFVLSIPKLIAVPGKHLGMGAGIIGVIAIPALLALTMSVVSFLTYKRRSEFYIYKLPKTEMIDFELIKSKYIHVKRGMDSSTFIKKEDRIKYADYKLMHDRFDT